MARKNSPRKYSFTAIALANDARNQHGTKTNTLCVFLAKLRGPAGQSWASEGPTIGTMLAAAKPRARTQYSDGRGGGLKGIPAKQAPR